jgi:class 3 adenylate cyclase
MVTCPSCSEENPERFKLCGFCGTPLQAALPPQEQRKTVTIVFSDLKGSTSLGETLDSEALREVMTRYFDAMKAELIRHGGTIEKFIGDAIMAVFGLPVVHEDDALRAVRAAEGMRRALTELNDSLERSAGVRLTNRTGVNTGEVVTGDAATAQRLVTGDAVNTAARLEQAAPANEVLLGELTWQLVRDAVEVEPVEPLELKGKAERVPAYRLVRVHGQDGRARRQDAPLVGREHELTAIGDAFRVTIASGRSRLVTVVADAGVGKSRLVREFTTSISHEAEVVRGRCLPYGDGITFWPLIEIVRGSAGVTDDDTPQQARAKLLALVGERDVAARLASVMGLAPTQFPLSEIDWASRRLLELMSARRPVVAIVDDIHWAEDAFLGLLEHVLDTAEAPVLLLATARPDLLEARPDWGEREGSTRLELAPLSVDDAGRIVEALLGTADLPAEVRHRIATASEGNPLYVEQLLSMLVESGALRRSGSGWVRAPGGEDLAIPPTISALLTARLDRLSREERAVVEPASVVGLHFPQAAIVSMTAEPITSAVPQHLGSLVRKQLVRTDASPEEPESDYRFAHLLIRDAAYATLLKRNRADLHERFVAWADQVNAERDRELEFEEILGWHLEQAYLYRTELGPVDEEGRRVGAEAARRLSNAGRRAYARGDLHAAATLLRRASALLEDHDPDRLALQPDLAEVLMEVGEFAEANSVVEAAAEAADEIFDDRLRAHALLIGHLIGYYTGTSEASRETFLADSREANGVFEREGDHTGMARAWRLIYAVESGALRFGAASTAAERIGDHARQAQDARQAARGAVAYAQAALYGPTPVTEAIEHCEAVFSQAADDRRTRALVSTSLAELHAMAGDTERARGLYRTARATFEELGNRLLASSVSTNSWRVEYLAGDLDAAAAELGRDRAALEELQEQQLRSTIAGLLARVEAERGDLGAAERHSQEAEGIAEADDLDAQAAWRVARARVLASRGEQEGADALSAAAVEMLRPIDAPAVLADALVQRAEILLVAGRADEAAMLREEARSLYVAKGDIASAGQLTAVET